ncbi:MAG: hypothetical protein AB1631_25540 [Acidobacteriota bacterium]
MWVIYRKKDRSIVGMSADCEPDLDKKFALEEVVRGLVDVEPLSRYDAIQVEDRAKAQAILNAPREHLVISEGAKGKIQLVVEEPRLSYLLMSSDAPDAHPVDGIPEIAADGVSFTTITVQKIDDRGQMQQSKNDNDLLYLRSDFGTLRSADGKEEITSVRLKKGQAVFRLVSEKARRVATVRAFNADSGLENRAIRIEFI